MRRRMEGEETFIGPGGIIAVPQNICPNVKPLTNSVELLYINFKAYGYCFSSYNS